MWKLIADIFGTIGMAFFLFAELKQLLKIRKTGMCLGISFTAYKTKMIACLCSLTCFGLTALWGSFLVILAETVVIAPILRRLWREKQ